jgi:hypothetical protein
VGELLRSLDPLNMYLAMHRCLNLDSQARTASVTLFDILSNKQNNQKTRTVLNKPAMSAFVGDVF